MDFANAQPLTGAVLTVEQIKTGRFYIVIKAGEADPTLTGAVVLGADRHLEYAAVTVWSKHGIWLGTTWCAERHAPVLRDGQYVDRDARFVELAETKPEVWIASDRQDCGRYENEQRVFRTREAAIAAARGWIADYSQRSALADQIPALLAHFDELAATEGGVFGVGDDACEFYVEVCRHDVQGNP